MLEFHKKTTFLNFDTEKKCQQFVRILNIVAQGYTKQLKDFDKKVILLGTVSNKFSDQEVIQEIKNAIIKITEIESILPSEILFRFHPRTSQLLIKAAKIELPCEFENNPICMSEVYFSHEAIKSVYSFHSTASISAKLMGKNSFFLQSKLFGRENRFISRQISVISRRFAIPVIEC